MSRIIFTITMLCLSWITVSGQSKLITKTEQKFNAFSGNWENFEKEAFIYHPTFDKLAKQTSYLWNGAKWEFRKEESWEYLNNGLLEKRSELVSNNGLIIESSDDYVYNSDGSIASLKQVKGLSPNVAIRIENNYFYDANGRLTEFFIEEAEPNDNFRLKRKEQMTYNAEGCLATKYIEDYEVSAMKRTTKTTYFYHNNCVLDKEEIEYIFYFLLNPPAIRQYEVFHYNYSENDTKVDSTVRYILENDNEWSLSNTKVLVFDERNRLIKDALIEPISHDVIKTYEYDEKDSIIIEKESWADVGEPEFLVFDRENVYTYDENDHLVEANFFSFNDLKDKITYENFCDGLPKIRRNTKVDLSPSLFEINVRTYFEYSLQTECETIDNPETIILSPNPASQIIVIESDLLSSGNAALTVYDMQGKQIVFQPNLPRTPRFELSVDNLAVGIYILQLSNDKTSTTKKFTVQR